MKKIGSIFVHAVIIFAFTVLLSVSFSAFAETDGIFTYTVSGGEATVTKVDFSGQSEIIIPEELGGSTVTALSDRAFMDSTYTYGDDTVESVFIPKTVRTFSGDPFSYADIRKIFVDPENEFYSSDKYGVLFNRDQTSLIKACISFEEEYYSVPESVTSIKSYAFQSCQNIVEIDLPDRLDSIGSQSFYDIGPLKSINISEGIETVPQNAFAYCTSLKHVTLPSTLKSIQGSAFTECYSLKEIVVPEGVTLIDNYAFESDSSLERIVLPSTLQTVGKAIVGNCPELKHVYFAGSEDDWIALNVKTGSYIGSRVDAFDTATFHFDFDVSPYKTLSVTFENDILTVSGSGEIPEGRDGAFQFWDERKDEVTALFISGEVASVEEKAFSSFPNLAYVIIDTPNTSFAPNAFSDCEKLESVVFFGSASLSGASVESDAELVQIYHPSGESFSGISDSAKIHTIEFSYEDGTLAFNGGVEWDGYQFLDTMSAFCLRFDPINKIKCSTFTFDALPMYGTTNDGNYERIEENRLLEAELTVETDDEIISWNELVSGISDGTISDFRIISKDKNHEEIKDTPVMTKEDEGGLIGAIRKALRWIVTLMNKLFNLISKLGKR